MRFKITRFFCITGLIFCINLLLSAQNSAEKNEDYKKWSFEQLLFTIDSGLLDEQKEGEYIEFYLQKAKKENSKQDIVTGYRKKVTYFKDYELQKLYGDSLLLYAEQIKDKQITGVAYNTKRYIEFVAKNYEKALEYGLQAEEYLEEVNDLYTLNKVKGSIGAIYYHLEEYPKAYKFFKETTTYYKKKSDNSYNNLRGYVSSLFGLSKATFRLQKNDTLPALLDEGYTAAGKLKQKSKSLETAYFSLVEGMYHHTLQDYQKSDSLLNAALPHIKENNDFANEHLVYLYLGKNVWQSGKKQQALGYFEKIDLLYQNENFINTELSEAYSYIIDYYKEQKNPERQLHYTNILLQISNELQKNNKQLTTYLHTNLDTKKLEESKAQLEKEISQNKAWSKGIYVIIAALIILIIGLFIGYKKSKKQLRDKYERLVEQRQNLQEKQETPAPAENSEQEKAAVEIPDTAQIILEKLATFESNKGFLQKITLEDLADELLTNRTTLSQVLNEHKGGFKDYIKKLRIDYAVKEISSKPQLQELKLDVLAEEFGFGSAKSFSIAFKEVTDISVSDFIRLSRQNAGKSVG